VGKVSFANPNNKTIIMVALINFPTDLDENHRLAPIAVVRGGTYSATVCF
jgi:hypothetical protein